MSQKYCPSIVGLELDEQSKKAIERINEIHDVTKFGHIATTIGHLLVIFGGNAVQTQSAGLKLLETPLGKAVSSNASQTGWSISQTNWEYFFKSFGALSEHAQTRIWTIAGQEALRTWQDPKQQAFWRAIHNGCQIK